MDRDEDVGKKLVVGDNKGEDASFNGCCILILLLLNLLSTLSLSRSLSTLFLPDEREYICIQCYGGTDGEGLSSTHGGRGKGKRFDF
jgi:hypothetical protein